MHPLERGLLHGLRRRPTPQPLPLLACKGSRRQCISTLWPRRERLASPDSTLHPPPSCRQTLEPSAGLGTAALGRQPCWPCSFTHHHLEAQRGRHAEVWQGPDPHPSPAQFLPVDSVAVGEGQDWLDSWFEEQVARPQSSPCAWVFFRSVCGSEGAWMSTRQAMGF